MNKLPGFAFRLTGLILGIVAIVTGITGVVFSTIGFLQARQCKNCKMDGTYQ